jgi:CubicO group peptidase (beta-lactamase class C family)
VALCMHMLVDRGLLDLEAPVARYWPEFAAEGKQDVTVLDVLSHQAKLPAVRTPLTVEESLDHLRMAELLAAQPQEQDPRAAFTYHRLTYGWLCGELIRRVDGRSLGRFFDEEIAQPLRLALWIGLPPELEPRVAHLVIAPPPADASASRFDIERDADDLWQAVWTNPPMWQGELAWNSPALHAAELGGANAIGTPRSLARLFGCLANGGSLDGVRLLAEHTLESGRREAARGHDALVGREMAFGAGFALQSAMGEFGPPADAFGHSGAGGSRHGAWPSLRTGFSYAMNELRDDRTQDPRAAALLDALHDCVRSAA